MVKISVIIPNYNRAKIVSETVENMLLQSLPPHEIIVVDDCSTDDSVSVLKSFGNKITLIQQAENRGPGAARNAALRIVTGDFVQFMDSDDLSSLNKLQHQSAILEETDGDIVYSPWVRGYFLKKVFHPEDVVLQQQALPTVKDMLTWFITEWSIIFQQCLFRRVFLEKVGFYREDMRLYEDGEFFVRLLLAGPKVVFTKNVLTLYRSENPEDHDKLTGSGSNAQRKAMDTAHFFNIVIELLAKERHPVLGHWRFRLNVWRALRDMQKLEHIDQENLSKLKLITRGREWDMLDWLDKKWGGFRQRIRGHRWPSSYQAGPLTEQQKSLIREIGYEIFWEKKRAWHYLIF
ncbi:MAG: glycosyltransferase [Pseudomonadota bacterium]